MRLKLGKNVFNFDNLREFWAIYKDIFVEHVYDFPTTGKNPLIIDCGSHIGISLIYFKNKFPNSKITAFEPDPQSFSFLKENVQQNNLQDVKLVNSAVAEKAGKMKFFSSLKRKNLLNNNVWSWGNSLTKHPWIKNDTHQVLDVTVIALSSYLNSAVDLIKLDVEGLETAILEEIRPKLKLIKNLIIEFHFPDVPKGNRLETIVSILEQSGFSLSFKYEGKAIKQEKLNTKSSFVIVYARRKPSE